MLHKKCDKMYQTPILLAVVQPSQQHTSLKLDAWPAPWVCTAQSVPSFVSFSTGSSWRLSAWSCRSWCSSLYLIVPESTFFYPCQLDRCSFPASLEMLTRFVPDLSWNLLSKIPGKSWLTGQIIIKDFKLKNCSQLLFVEDTLWIIDNHLCA